MKNIKLKKLGNAYILGLILILAYGCERDVTDDAVPATFNSTADIFIDNPVGLTDEFFESFDPAEGYNTDDTFEVVSDEAYEGTSSIRIDVPSPDNPNGFLAGGIFRDRGVGRDLSGYDALTFWAKATTTATLASVGFGADFEEDKFTVVRNDLELTTNWTKYIIPIPDPSKLEQERGLFSYIAAPFDVLGDGPNGNEIGWTFWLDEIRFEKLGTLGQPRPRIYNGEELVEEAFTGSTFQVNPLTYTANLPTGINTTVTAAPSYFVFESSSPSVASVNDLGEITVLGDGTTTVTATLANVLAEGSITITSEGAFPTAPTPTQPATNVLSVFSDAYTAEVIPNFTPNFGGSTTVTTVTSINGDEIANYTNNNFTGILWDDSPIDASAMQFMHVDVFVSDAATSVEFQIRDIGPNGMVETNIFTGQPEGDDADYRFTASGLTAGAWTQFEIPLAGNLATQRDNLGAIILVNGPDFILDNIYFYTN
ncbi:glycosyl hydrolase family 16 [uncultured Psychroserpens sp.]|uniref:glycosyl hydrolase family 16 n=1 Tax=uncultured Psychroserpens sp. TaxID=255436 RepID=UPI00263909F8|nr:glycosyl hydrolase family 16 [uncultured Psychroserpens sp.]